MNTPATPLYATGTKDAATEPPARASQVPPTDSDGSDRVTALRAGLEAWKASGGERGAPKDPIEKLAEAPTSLRAAVTAKCWDCQGRDADPAPKWRIGNCSCDTCPLHAVRPWQRLAGTAVPKVLGDQPESDPT